VCIIGSGPAGWAIAEGLRHTRLRLVMLESGGREPEPGAQALNRVSSVGVPLLNGRERRLGGTSPVWAGRCTTLDEVDYERRDWVPLSGWPVARETLAPYTDRAAVLLGAGPVPPRRRTSRAEHRLARIDPSLPSTPMPVAGASSPWRLPARRSTARSSRREPSCSAPAALRTPGSSCTQTGSGATGSATAMTSWAAISWTIRATSNRRSSSTSTRRRRSSACSGPAAYPAATAGASAPVAWRSARSASGATDC
jgi:choline dehydrogenase-like flavoprotein